VVLVAGGLWYGQGRSLDIVSASQVDETTGGAVGEADIDWTADYTATGTADDGDTAMPAWVDDGSDEPAPAGGGAAAEPSPAAEPDETPSATATVGVTPQPTAAPKVSNVLPSGVKPPLAQARRDMERPWRDGCLVFEAGTTPPKCVYGDPKGDYRVALVGDSHASALFPAVDAVARHLGWRLETYLKVDCPFIDMSVRSISLKRAYGECTDWRQAVAARLAASPPDLVIVTNSRWIHPVLARDESVMRQGAALARMISRLPGLVVVIADTPAADRDIPACLSAHTKDIRACAVPRSTAFSGSMVKRERLGVRGSGAKLVDLTVAVCSADPCPAVVRGMIVLRDSHHLTATFARSLAPALNRALAAILHPDIAPTPSPTPAPAGGRAQVPSDDRAVRTRRRRPVARRSGAPRRRTG